MEYAAMEYEHDAAGLATSDAQASATVLPPSVVEAQIHEANGVDPSEKPAIEGVSVEAHDELRKRVIDAESDVSELGLAVSLILKHLDPAGTSHAFDELRRL